jgi:hypothetical protein
MKRVEVARTVAEQSEEAQRIHFMDVLMRGLYGGYVSLMELMAIALMNKRMKAKYRAARERLRRRLR